MAVKQIKPEWVGKMDKLAWQLPLGFLFATFIISLAVSSYSLYKGKQSEIDNLKIDLETARKQAYPSISTIMMQEHFKDKDIPLGEFGIANSELHNKTFINCRIYGAIVMYLRKNNVVNYCSLWGDIDSSFIITTNEKISGVLAIDDCTFINCTFYNISFIGNKNQIERLKEKFP